MSCISKSRRFFSFILLKIKPEKNAMIPASAVKQQTNKVGNLSTNPVLIKSERIGMKKPIATANSASAMVPKNASGR